MHGYASLADQSSKSPKRSYSVVTPARQAAPLVFASPHSGHDYDPAFVAASRLSLRALRRSEDAFVDKLFGSAPSLGAPLLQALFPRVYIDPNREPYELDPAMFSDALPEFANRASPRVTAGLGTIARVITSGEEIYAEKLRVEEALQRIDAHYFPYHAALQSLLDTTSEKFGCVLLIDCHSMPSIGGPMDCDPGAKRYDFVLGDCFGTSCAPFVTEFVEQALASLGYSVRRNIPYAGGYTTRHYGRPNAGRHALQIEVNRGIYMDETGIAPLSGFDLLAKNVAKLIETLMQIDVSRLRAAST